MKKKLIVCVLAMAALIFVFASCKNGGADNGDDPSDAGQGVSSVSVSVVYPEGSDDAFIAEEIWTNVVYAFENATSLNSDASPEADREIAIGNTNRKITAKAFELLETEREERECEYPMFLVYSDGNSLACVYDEHEEAKKMLLDYLSDNRVAENLFSLSSGVIYANDIITVLEAEDKVTVANAWSKVEEKLGAEITAELKKLYSLYSDDVISWFANLYEPNICICEGECENTRYCGGGGYYYSNSARNTPGYLPDIESTGQALGWISSTGMLGDSSLKTVIPEWMQKQIVRFIKSCQDSNGYFYHPQWSKAAIDNNTARRTRDLERAISTLSWFGAKPTYSTYYEDDLIEGDGILYDGTPLTDILPASSVRLTESLTTPKALGVYKVVQINTVLPSYLVDAEGMRDYLSKLDITSNSYYIGNQLSNISKEILWRDKQLKEQNKEPLAEVLINWLNVNQNSENGLWSTKSNYNAVNGFFKIAVVYNTLGYPIPNIEKGLTASINAIISDDAPEGVTDIYNTWYNVLLVKENIENCYDEGNENVDLALEILYSKAPEAISKTREKLSLFLKDDGSFSYFQQYSSSTSQEMQVAVPNTNEGDVNATALATTGTANRILTALGIDDSDRIPMYTKSDLLRYLHILEQLQPVIKDEVPDFDKITFDDYVVGEIPDEIECTKNDTSFKGDYYPANGGFEVIKDTDEGSDRGNIFKIESVKGIYNAAKIYIPGESVTAQCYTFQADICIPSSSEDYALRLRMSDCYALAFKMYDGRVNLWDVSTTGEVIEQTDLEIGVDFGKWFNLKLEYYTGSHNAVRVKIYIDNVLMAVSDNYYDQLGKKITEGEGTPSSSYSYVSLSTMNALDTTVLIDNILCKKSSKTYEPYTDIENPLAVNVDAPDPGEKIYDFEDCDGEDNFPEGFVVSGSGVSVTADTDKALNINASEAGAVIEIPANNRAYGANCFVTEMDITPSALSSGTKLRFELVGKKNPEAKLAIFDLVAVESEGEKYFALADAHEGVTSALLHTLLIPAGTESKLKIEYYNDEKITLVYLNDKLLTASATATTEKEESAFGALRILNIGSGETDLSLDNLKVESVIKELKVEVYKNEKIFDFDTEQYGELVIEGATVTQDEDKSIEISAEGSLKFPVIIRSPLINASCFEAEAAFSDSGEYVIFFSDKNDIIIAALRLKVNNKTVSVYELTEAGETQTAIAEFDCDGEFKLSLKWYKNERRLALYADEKLVALTSLYYSEAGVNEWAEYFKISAVSGSVLIDNAKCESVYELFERSENFEIENSENGAEKLTFESTGSIDVLPSSVTVQGQGENTFKISMLEANKVLTVDTVNDNATGLTTLSFDMNQPISDAETFVLEFELYISAADIDSNNWTVQLRDADGVKIAELGVNEKLKLWYKHGDDNLSMTDATLSTDVWTKFRIEYIDFGETYGLRIYVDGKSALKLTDYVYSKANPVSREVCAITNVRFHTYGDLVTHFDNVVVKQDKIENLFVEEVPVIIIPEIYDFEDYKEISEITGATLSHANGGNAFKITEVEEGNKALTIDTANTGATRGLTSAVFDMHNTVTDADAVLLEFDFYVCATDTARSNWTIQLRDGNGVKIVELSINEKFTLCYTNGNGDVGTTSASLSTETWMTLRVEYLDLGDTMGLKVYLGEDCVLNLSNYSITSVSPESRDISAIANFRIHTYSDAAIAHFDNLVFKQEKTATNE